MMRRLRALPILAVLLALAACKTAETPVHEVELLPAEAVEPVAVEPEPTADTVDELDEQIPMKVWPGTRYFSRDSAPRCPEIVVSDARGEDVRLQPGREGFVTLVVFFAMDWRAAVAAALHVSDLQKAHQDLNVRAVGVVLKTARADQAQIFAGRAGIEFPLYYDDLGALEEMAEEVGAENKRALPAIFAVDRHLRLRFYRPGFRFETVAQAGWPTRAGQMTAPGPETIEESAPPDQTVEAYLKMILREG